TTLSRCNGLDPPTRETFQNARIHNPAGCACTRSFELLCSAESIGRKECRTQQHHAKVRTRINDECNQSCTDSLLVWMEHCLIHKEDPPSPKGFLQHLHRRHWLRNSFGQLRLHLRRIIDC